MYIISELQPTGLIPLFATRDIWFIRPVLSRYLNLVTRDSWFAFDTLEWVNGILTPKSTMVYANTHNYTMKRTFYVQFIPGMKIKGFKKNLDCHVFE